MRATFHTEYSNFGLVMRLSPSRSLTYTCTFRSSIFADGFWGETRTVRAMMPARQKDTVVKNPKTFCSLTRAECIFTLHWVAAQDPVIQA